MVSKTLLDEAVRRLTEHFRLEKIILFGSQGRGTAGARSDVDLLVICALPRQGPGRRELITAMYRALRGLGVGSDLVVMTPEEFDLERQIPGSVARPADREGRVLYERAA